MSAPSPASGTTPAALSTATLLEEQVELLHAGDWRALVRRYHPDAVLVRPDLVAEGLPAVTEVLSSLCAQQPRIKQVHSVGRGADTLVYDATQTVGGRTLRTVGTFVLRDGLIWRQSAVVVPEVPR